MNNIEEIIATLSKTFLEEARRADKENIFPTNNFAALKQNDLLGLIIPSQFGGLGVDFAHYQRCISLIAQSCPATASAFNMHNIILGALADIPFNKLDANQAKNIMPFVERIFDEVITYKKVFASATSEPHIGARYSKTMTHYQAVDDGYLINGEKSFVTMANYADYYSIIANRKTTDGSLAETHHLTFFLISRTQSGVSVVEDWDTLGMRATQSHRVIFQDVFVPKENVFFGITGFALMKIIRMPHWVIGGYLGVYLGIIDAAYEFVLQYIQAKTDIIQKTGLGFEPIIQMRLAELYSLRQHAHLVVREAANQIIANQNPLEAHRLLYLAKYTVGETAMELTSRALKLCGSSTIHKKYDLERYFRDSRCGALMPTTSDVCQLHIGRSLLGISVDSLW